MTPEDFPETNREHRECWDILPWIANERASAKDRMRVEQHVRDCAACRDELERQRVLRDAIRQDEAIVIAPQTSLQKLMQRIDGNLEEEPAAPSALEPVDETASLPVGRPMARWLPIAAVIQAIAIAALLGTVWLQSRATLEAPRFTTLTASSSVAHGPVIRVVFDPDVSVVDINSVLQSIHAQIVSGPSEAGVFTLALPDDAQAADRVHQALIRLRSDPQVIFAEVAVARPEPQ